MKKTKEIQIYIKDEETFLNNYYNENYKKLLGKFYLQSIHLNKLSLVVDVHPTWCGPCEMMFPTYKSLASTIDDFDKRIEFIMV